MNIEGRRIDTKLYCRPFADDGGAEEREAATRGSERLLDAILRAQGRPVPVRRQPRRIPDVILIPPMRLKAPESPVANIQNTVATYFEIQPRLMVSERKTKKLAEARQVAMYLASELTNHSLVRIGKFFGGRDHTTVMHGIKMVEKRMAESAELRDDVARLMEALGG